MCKTKLCLCLDFLWHIGHSNFGSTPHSNLICRLRLCGRAYELPQRPHVCKPPGTGPWCDEGIDDFGIVGINEPTFCDDADGDDISEPGDNNGVAVGPEPGCVGDITNNFDDVILCTADIDAIANDDGIWIVFDGVGVSNSLNRTAGVKRRKSQGWSSVGDVCRIFILTSPVGCIKLLNFMEVNTIFG